MSALTPERLRALAKWFADDADIEMMIENPQNAAQEASDAITELLSLRAQLQAREQAAETMRKYFIDGIERLLTKWSERAADKNWHGWEGPAATDKCAEDLALLSVSSPSVPPQTTAGGK